MWIFKAQSSSIQIGAGMAVLTAIVDPDGSITGFATAIVFIASVYGLMAAPTLRSLLYAAGLAAIAALAFAATVARYVPQLIALVQYFQRGRTRLLTAAELDAHAKELLAAETEPPLADPTLREQRDARVRRRKTRSDSTKH